MDEKKFLFREVRHDTTIIEYILVNVQFESGILHAQKIGMRDTEHYFPTRYKSCDATNFYASPAVPYTLTEIIEKK